MVDPPDVRRAELGEQLRDALFFLARADDPHLDVVGLEQLGGAHDDVDSVELDERAVEEDPPRSRLDVWSRSEHVVVRADPNHTDALPGDTREIGIEVGMARSVGDDPPCRPQAGTVDGADEASEHRPAADECAVGHDGVRDGDEGVEQDGHAAQARERREYDDVEPPGIEHDDHIAARRAREAPDQLGVGGCGARQRGDQATVRYLVAGASPEGDVTPDDVVAGRVEQCEQSTVASEVRVVGAGHDDARHDGGRYAFRPGPKLSDSRRMRFTEPTRGGDGRER